MFPPGDHAMVIVCFHQVTMLWLLYVSTRWLCYGYCMFLPGDHAMVIVCFHQVTHAMVIVCSPTRWPWYGYCMFPHQVTMLWLMYVFRVKDKIYISTYTAMIQKILEYHICIILLSSHWINFGMNCTATSEQN